LKVRSKCFTDYYNDYYYRVVYYLSSFSGSDRKNRVGKTEETILAASEEVEYYTSGNAKPSTLKKWCKVWRKQASRKDSK